MASAKKSARIAVVGMGIGRPNGAALARNPRGNVVALCDLLEDRMKAFAKDLPDEVKFYTDYKEMCKASDIDAVFVGTPNQWHVPIALEGSAERQTRHGNETARRLRGSGAKTGHGSRSSRCRQYDVALHALRR